MATKTKALSYEERLKQTTSQKEQAEITHDVSDAKLEIKGEKNKTERKIAQLERSLEDAKSAKPFNLEKIIHAKEELDLYKKRLSDLSEIETELGLES